MGNSFAKQPSPIKRALYAIGDLTAKLSAVEAQKHEPIAVIGMGCRFPGGAVSPAAFWKLLQQGKNAVGPIPGDRWNIDDYYDADPDAPGKMYIRNGAFLADVDRFDAPFFGISPREAVCMDPQHRLMLEVGWEALEYAGIAPDSLQGSRTGVFVGIGQNDYARLKLTSADATQIDTYDGTGNLLCFAPGRLAYALGLNGPNLAIDTACSSSLVALHQACQSLRAQECDLALAGGAHLVISPEVTIFLSRAHVLSKEGRCQTFDAAADGFVRGEGCGMIVLKRLADARRDRDTILALIRGSAVNHDGASSGLTVPSEGAQEALIRQAVAQAKVDPRQVSYVEAHGTGTPLGDPIEVNALAAALCQDRPADNPLLIGSVKTNVGHLEAAAGIAGIIKVILALQHRTLPSHLHFKTPNPHIDWENLPIRVTSDDGPWPSKEGQRIAGVSSFGFSGTNAHIIVEESRNPEAPALSEEAAKIHLLTLSAKNEAALLALAASYETYLAEHPRYAVGDICYSANTGRSQFPKRLAVVAATRDQLQDALAAFRKGKPLPGVYTQGKGGNSASPPPDGDHGEGRPLAALAAEFVQGGEIDWKKVYGATGYRKVVLPTYPFQRQRYWVSQKEKESSKGTEAATGMSDATPPWGRRLNLPFSSEVRFEHAFSADTPAHLADHKLLGTIVVSAATQIATILAAVGKTFGHDIIRVQDLVFSQPLIIPAKGETPVQIIFDPDGQGGDAFRLVSGNSEGEADDKADWKTHASGTVLPAPGDKSSQRSLLFDAGRCRSRAERILSSKDFYAARRHSGYQFGPAFQWAQRIWQRKNEILAQMGPHLTGASQEGYPIDPGLLDSCFQMLDACWQDDPYDEYLHLPVKIAELRYYRQPTKGTLWCQAQGAVEGGADGGNRRGNLRLLDQRGETLMAVEGFELGRARREIFLSRISKGASVLDVNWRLLPALPGVENPREPDGGSWLLFADQGGIAEELAVGLRGSGQEVFLVTPERRCIKFAPDRFGINPEIPADFERLLAALGTNLKGVVYLWGLDLGQQVDLQTIQRSEVICSGFCAAVSALVDNPAGGPLPAVWLVTQGSQSVGRGPTAPLQAMLWGLGGVLELEHPELHPRAVDLEFEKTEHRIPMLLKEMLHPDAENRIALRGVTRHGARLAPQTQKQTQKQADGPILTADAGYLITGGFGALGLEVAHWMARNGARHLSLCGRSRPNGTVMEKIDRIRQTGCKVQAFTADVSEYRDINNLFAAVESRMPPLRGIIHAAGVVEDALITHQSRLHFKKVMAPKVRGTWLLHEAAAHLPLDFFICFSSTAAVIGSGGQANYAAANAFMDALAHARRADGLAGMSINWGAWGDVGMASRLNTDTKMRLSGQGLGELAPKEGLAIFEKLLGRDEVQAVVMAVDWEVYLKQRLLNKTVAPLFEAVAGEGNIPAGLDESEADDSAWLAKIPLDQRHARLFKYVRSQVAATLGMSSADPLEPRQRLFDVGIDSLMAVELKNRLEAGLGVRLRATLVFDYPTVAALTTHLCEGPLADLFIQEPKEALQAATADDEEVNALLAQIEAMPEQELKTLFAGSKV